MREELVRLKNDIDTLIANLESNDFFTPGDDLIIGSSTSEVLGHHIGKNSSIEVAEILFEAFLEAAEKHDVNLMFQGCEHINRAVTMEYETAQSKGCRPVNVIPHSQAGGSLSEYAYKHLRHPVVVEYVEADKGVDIGQTLIGMHLRHVAVPLRTEQKQVGNANVTVAFTRPKLIGGPRARY
ncbi:TIGR01440 family protein [Salinicoccus albus]|uniref:TIGR01440 family protein n=1 Tax=Salinicoccus albus TaxID=418756 RepID=UPI00036FC63A|nr:TIGR01440 family protein [Salinicoccus albus]